MIIDEESENVRFRNLSLSLKVAVVAVYVLGCISALSFIIGFIMGIIEC